MANLYFTVETDYQQLIQLQQQINKLENNLKNANPMITPRADITKMEDDLNKARQQFDALAQRAALMGDKVGKSSKQVTDAFKQINQATNNLKSAKDEVNALGESFNGAKYTLKGFVEQFTLAGLAFKGIQTAVSALKGSMSTIISFQAENATLGAITGATEETLQGFKDTAEQLGRTTMFTASQVTQLQISLAKLGFEPTEIHAMEGDVLNFAQAVGADLDEAASTTGAALRMFGVEKEDYEEKTRQFTNAMASAAMNSALDFRMIRDNLATFGPMAKSIGLQIEDVLALFGTLKNNGIEASTAMTSLRNIFTKLSQGKIEGMDKNIKTFDDFIKGLNGIKAAYDGDVGKAMKMIGPRGGTQFLTLLSQADKLDELRGKIREQMNQDKTGEMGEKMINNLAGQLKILQSAWEGLVLKFKSSDGLLKEMVADLTGLIGGITDMMPEKGFELPTEEIKDFVAVVGSAIAGIAVLKTGMMAMEGVKVVQDAFRAGELVAYEAKMKDILINKQKDVALEGTRTAEVKARNAVLQQQLALEREAVLAKLQLEVATTDATHQALIDQKIKILNNEEEIRFAREELAIATENERLERSAGNEQKRQNALGEMKLNIEREALALKERQRLQDELKNVEDNFLSAHGEKDLAYLDKLEGKIGGSTKKLGGFKGALSLLGLDMFLNPWIAGFAALGVAIYGCYEWYKKINAEQIQYNENMEKAVEEAKKISDATNSEVATIKTNVEILKRFDEDTEVYKDNLKALEEVTKKYGIQVKTTKNEQGEEITVVEDLIDKHEKLIAVIGEESKAREYAASMKVLYEAEESAKKEAKDKFKETLDDLGIENSEIAASVMMSFVPDEYFEALQDIIDAQNYINKLQKEGKTDTDEYNNVMSFWTDKMLRSKEIEAEIFEKVKDYGESNNWSNLQIGGSQVGIISDFASNLSKAIAMTNKGKDILKKDTEAKQQNLITTNNLSKGNLDFAKSAHTAQMSVATLQSKIKEMADDLKNGVKLKFQTVVENGVPQWMRKNLKMDTKEGGDLKEARRMSELYLNNAKKFEKQGFFKLNGQGNITVGEAILRAQQYAMAAMEIENAQKKNTTDNNKNKGGSGGNANDGKAKREKEKSYQKLLTENGKKREELARKIENEVTDAEINALENGEEKILRQRDKQYNDELEKIRKNAQSLKDEYIKMEEAEFNANPKNQGQKKIKANPTKGIQGQEAIDKATFNRAEAEKLERVKEYYNRVDELALKQMIALERKYYEESIKGYETATQKKLASEAKFLSALEGMRKKQKENETLINLITEPKVDNKEANKVKNNIEGAINIVSGVSVDTKANNTDIEKRTKAVKTLQDALNKALGGDYSSIKGLNTETLDAYIKSLGLAEDKANDLRNAIVGLSNVNVPTSSVERITQYMQTQIDDAKKKYADSKKAPIELKAENLSLDITDSEENVSNVTKQIDDFIASLDISVEEANKLKNSLLLLSNIKGMDSESMKKYAESLKESNKQLEGNKGEVYRQMNKEMVESRNAYIMKYGESEEKIAEIHRKYKDLMLQAEGDYWKQMSLKRKEEEEVNEVKANKKIENIKQDPNYIMAMEDPTMLTNEGLKTLKKNLDEARNELKDLPPDQLKAIADLVGKINDELISRNPFQSWRQGVKELKDAQKEYNDSLKVLEEKKGAFDEAKNYENNLESSVLNLSAKKRANDIVIEENTAKLEESGGTDVVASENLRIAREEEVSITEELLVKEQELKDLREEKHTQAYTEAEKELTDATNNNANSAQKVTKADAKVKASKKDVASAVGKLGSSISEIGSQMEQFGGKGGKIVNTIGGVVSAVSTAMTFSASTATGAMKALETASFVLTMLSTAIQLATAAADLLGLSKDDSSFENAKATYSELSSLWDEIIEKKKKYLDISWGDEIKEVSDDIEEIYKMQAETARAVAQERLSAGASKGSHSYGYRMNRDLENYFGAISQIAQTSITDISQLTQLSAEQLQSIKENQQMFWIGLDGDFRDCLNNIIDAQDKLDDFNKELNEKWTGLSFDNMYDSFVDTLMDMEKTSADYAKSMTENFTKALLQQEIGEKYQKRLKEWYEGYATLMKDNNGKLTEAQLEAVKDEYQAIIDQALVDRDNITELTGYSKNSGEAQGTIHSSMSISEDTANELVGRVTAMQLAVENSKVSTMESNASMKTTLMSINDTLSKSLSDIMTKQDTSKVSLDALSDVLAQSVLELQGIKSNTDKVITPITNMSNDINEMKNKIINL